MAAGTDTSVPSRAWDARRAEVPAQTGRVRRSPQSWAGWPASRSGRSGAPPAGSAPRPPAPYCSRPPRRRRDGSAAGRDTAALAPHPDERRHIGAARLAGGPGEARRTGHRRHGSRRAGRCHGVPTPEGRARPAGRCSRGARPRGRRPRGLAAGRRCRHGAGLPRGVGGDVQKRPGLAAGRVSGRSGPALRGPPGVSVPLRRHRRRPAARRGAGRDLRAGRPRRGHRAVPRRPRRTGPRSGHGRPARAGVLRAHHPVLTRHHARAAPVGATRLPALSHTRRPTARAGEGPP